MPFDTSRQSNWLPPTAPVTLHPPKFRLEVEREQEHELQLACTALLWKILLPDVAWTAIDHAHSLNMTIGRHGRPIGLIEAQKRKARGVKAGISDYLFWHKSRGFAIELKTVTGVLSDGQKDFLNQMIAAGVEVSVCWTLDLVAERVKGWGLCRGFTVTA